MTEVPMGRTGRRPATRRAVALLAVAALVATACGGGGSSASTPGVTATSITLGSHQPLTGVAAPGYSEIAPAAKAMFDYINSKGGVNGRKITFNYQDDAYNPTQTATVVRKLVLQDNVFAILGGLGTPTHQQVEPFLNTDKVPDIFVASGCTCWNDTAKYPYTTGYQTNYTIEGRILGNYIQKNMGGDKVGYLLQNDDVGQTGSAGLDKEIQPSSTVVSKQNYDASALGSGLGNQVAALKASGAKVVAVFAIPAAFALALLAAAQIGYQPQWVVSSIGSDAPTLAGLLNSFSKGAAGTALLQGVLTATYLPIFSDSANPWIQLFHKIHDQFDTSVPAFDGNTVYGMAYAYNFYQLLQKAGKSLTRKSLMDAVNSADLTGPGLAPLVMRASDHRGYQAEQMAKFDQGKATLFGPVYSAVESGPISTPSIPQAAPPAGF